MQRIFEDDKLDRVVFLIDKDVKEVFTQKCEKMGVKRGEVLRAYINSFCKNR